MQLRTSEDGKDDTAGTCLCTQLYLRLEGRYRHSIEHHRPICLLQRTVISSREQNNPTNIGLEKSKFQFLGHVDLAEGVDSEIKKVYTNALANQFAIRFLCPHVTGIPCVLGNSPAIKVAVMTRAIANL